MIFWIREIAGWLLVGVGLLIFVFVFEFCENRFMFEAFILMMVGVVVFRGGIHLLKVAVAARICQQAQQHLYPAPPPSTGLRPSAPSAVGRARSNVPAPARRGVERP